MTLSVLALSSTLFPLGDVVATSGALTVLEQLGASPASLLIRHSIGDWGDLREEDRNTNWEAVQHGFRIMSSYRLTEDMKVWVITEADRTITTLLLPEEY